MKYESSVTQSRHNGAWSAWWWFDKEPAISLGEFPTRTDAERAVQDAQQRHQYNETTKETPHG